MNYKRKGHFTSESVPLERNIILLFLFLCQKQAFPEQYCTVETNHNKNDDGKVPLGGIGSEGEALCVDMGQKIRDRNRYRSVQP